MQRVTVLLGVAVLGLGATACGGSNGGGLSAEEQEYSDAIVESFQTDDPNEITLTEEQAECVAPKWIKVIGVERLESAGLEPADLSADGSADVDKFGLDMDEAKTLFNSFGECKVDLQEKFIEALGEGDEVECFKDEIDDDLFERLMIAGFANDTAAERELFEELQAVSTACLGG